MRQHPERNTVHKHRHISLRLAAVLLLLVLGSSCYLTGVMARYTNVTADGDDARVAKFLITEKVKPNDKFDVGVDTAAITGETGPQAAAILEITNGGEVDVEYTITVEKPYKNLPIELSITDPSTRAAVGSSPFKIQLQPGTSETYELSVEWKSGENALDYMGMVDYISVTAEAVQMD